MKNKARIFKNTYWIIIIEFIALATFIINVWGFCENILHELMAVKTYKVKLTETDWFVIQDNIYLTKQQNKCLRVSFPKSKLNTRRKLLMNVFECELPV